MKEFEISEINGGEADLSFPVTQLDEVGGPIHFTLGKLELSVVGTGYSSDWDFERVGRIFLSRSFYTKEYLDTLQYSDSVRVTVKTNYPVEGLDHYVSVAFLDSAQEVVAYISLDKDNFFGSPRYRFKVLKFDCLLTKILLNS